MGKRRHDRTGRSTGEPRFVQIPYWVLETEAARRLSGTATKVLLYLIKRHNGMNNGQISFGERSGCFVRDTETRKPVDVCIGIKPRTVCDALYELEQAGFIFCTKESSFGQKRMTKDWRLTWLPCGNDLPTKEFATATGNFRRPKKPKKQKPERPRALDSKLQSARAPRAPPSDGQNPHYRAPARPMSENDRAPTRSHLVTIPSEAIEPASAVSDAGPSVSAGVLHSRLVSAARGPHGLSLGDR
jgi:hypothetical protein